MVNAMPMDSIRHNLFWKQAQCTENLFAGGYKYTTGGTGGIANWDVLVESSVELVLMLIHYLFIIFVDNEPSQLVLDGMK